MLDIEDRCIEAMNIAWRKSIRFLLGLHPRTKSYILPYIVDCFSLTDLIMERQMNFYINVYNHPSKNVSNYLKNALICNSSYTVRNLNVFLNKFHITMNDLFLKNKQQIKMLIRKSYQPMDWRAGMLEELLYARDGIVDFGFNTEELKIILTNVCCDEI